MQTKPLLEKIVLYLRQILLHQNSQTNLVCGGTDLHLFYQKYYLQFYEQITQIPQKSLGVSRVGGLLPIL